MNKIMTKRAAVSAAALAMIGGGAAMTATTASAGTASPVQQARHHPHHMPRMWNISMADYCMAFYRGNAVEVNQGPDGWQGWPTRSGSILGRSMGVVEIRI